VRDARARSRVNWGCQIAARRYEKIVRAQRHQPADPQHAPPAGVREREHVSALIVDDDDDAREVLASILRKHGYTVVTAANGRDALDLLETIRPEVIIIDLLMPVMDGASFREAQRRNREWLSIPTIVMTGTNEEPLLDIAVEETLRKPVRARELVEIVRRHCGER
jgi:two-component system, chemotaxis family, chemotaxis protein CheY